MRILTSDFQLFVFSEILPNPTFDPVKFCFSLRMIEFVLKATLTFYALLRDNHGFALRRNTKLV